MRIIISVMVCLIVLMFQLVYPAIPQTMSFQGVLKDNSGHPIVDSTYSVIFSIYSNPLNGNQLWSESQSVTTSNGLFNCILGNVHPIPDSAIQNPAFVGFGIEGQPEMSPRIALQSVPYAFSSNYASNADKVDGYEASDLREQFIPPQNIFRVFGNADNNILFTVQPGKVRYITNISVWIYGYPVSILISGQEILHFGSHFYSSSPQWTSGGAPIVVGPNESVTANGFGNNNQVTITGYEFDYTPPRR
jgi:hypothetical protein